MVKVQKTPNDQLVLTIPKKLAEFKGIGKGTKVIFKEHTKDSFILEIIKPKETSSKKNKKESNTKDQKKGAKKVVKRG